jgi:PAS domain-containing protein
LESKRLRDERRRVEEEKRISDERLHQLAATQSAILNALPAHIALLDPKGNIVAVNEAWRRFATANSLQGPDFAVGVNYLDVCARAQGEGANEARTAAAGITRVLRGEASEFAIEYPCHSPGTKRWFRLMVAPLREADRTSAVVMHVNITERKEAEETIRTQLFELERWRTVTLGREERVQTLKTEVNDLLIQEGKAPRYAATGIPPSGWTSIQG